MGYLHLAKIPFKKSVMALIRKIREEDNAEVASLIRSILEDMGVPKVGTAYADIALNDMFHAYDRPKAVFYVAESQRNIVGCVGIAQLEQGDEKVCELQKMYVSAAERGKGVAGRLLQHCFTAAIAHGYQSCYLETLPEMHAAQSLYKKHGFCYIDRPLGDTGHTACTVRMLKTLE